MFQWCVILRQFHMNNAIYFMRRMVALLMRKSWIEHLISKPISVVKMIVVVCFVVGNAHGLGCYQSQAPFTLGVRAHVQPKSSILLMQKLKSAQRALH